MKEFMVKLFNDDCIVVAGDSFFLTGDNTLTIRAGKDTADTEAKTVAVFHKDRWICIYEIQPAMKEPDQSTATTNKQYFGAAR